jgi:hypothetical protein
MKMTTSHARARLAAIAVIVAATSCRIGGPTYDGVAPGGADSGRDGGDAALEASLADAAPSADASTPGADSALFDGASDAPIADATLGDASLSDASREGASGDATQPPGPSDATADQQTADASCSAPAPVNVCDPVCNVGCAALTRCNVSDQPNTGVCMGMWLSGEGSACARTETTDSCAPQLTCVDGTCRRLCWGDGDCANATCCSEPVLLEAGASGFRTCGACGG